jgi:hypothetical protein
MTPDNVRKVFKEHRWHELAYTERRDDFGGYDNYFIVEKDQMYGIIWNCKGSSHRSIEIRLEWINKRKQFKASGSMLEYLKMQSNNRVPHYDLLLQKLRETLK